MRFPRHIRTLALIDLNWLHAAHIQGIILDLDNTIVSEDDRYVSPGAEDWIHQAQAGSFQLFLLSNTKRVYRVEYWSQVLRIPAISPARKPLPHSFRKALHHMNLHPSQVIVIGDSLHTDIWGAQLVGCPAIQVASLPHPPRWWERILGRWLHGTYLTVSEVAENPYYGHYGAPKALPG